MSQEAKKNKDFFCHCLQKKQFLQVMSNLGALTGNSRWCKMTVKRGVKLRRVRCKNIVKSHEVWLLFEPWKKKQKQNRTAKINSLLLSHSYFVAKISVALNFSKKRSSVVETHGDMLSQDNEIQLWSSKLRNVPNCQKSENKKYLFLLFHARILKS